MPEPAPSGKPYAVMQQIAVLSGGEVRMGPGTLYTTIQRLLELSLIEETGRRQDISSRRRYYRLTAAGKALLQLEFDRMHSVLRLARRKKLVFGDA